MGKQLNLHVRRTQLAKEEVWKLALKAPKRYRIICVTTNNILITVCHSYIEIFCSSTPKIKNKTKTEVGETLGRIHLKKQNLDKMDTRRVSALRTTGRSKSE